MYGRVDERNSIIKLMTELKSDGTTVLPILGIAGIGKTALAQNVYNDPIVKNQFDQRIWVWVSKNFDEVRLTREMLDYASQEKHQKISSFAKLQEILIGGITSRRFLLIFDDVWDSTADHIWNKLLAPLKYNDTKGSVILVTTRSLSVAKRVGTVKPIELGALEKHQFRSFFKTCAFGDEKYEGHPSLNIIGQEIEQKLHGNPLAAETAGMLLKGERSIDRWNSTLKKETWKSLQLNNGIMNSLKLSFDELPYSIQQCLLYCSIFPQNHDFLSNELVSVWISQGFVKYDHPTGRLEDIGRDYLSVLFNSGFFLLNESYNCTAGNQTCYVIPALMHDFVRLISRTEYAVIDGSGCNEMLPTIRHLSIVTDSAYHGGQRGNIIHNEKFEEIFQSVKNSVRKLRTLLLIGKCDNFFFPIFQKAQCLRMLQISATYTGFDFFLHNNSAHLRYLKLENKGRGEAFPAALNKSCHLQVLDVGHPTVLNSMNGLVSMRHLSVKMEPEFMDPHSICFWITQLQAMSDLVHLCVDQLQNVSSAEASGAKLRDKQQLETLHLSWTYLAHSIFGLPSPDQQDSITERDVLEGLEPCHKLKHLRISGYSGATSPAWLGTSVTCLQTLHVENCREWQQLTYLQRLPFLTRLKLRNMRKVTQVSLPSLLEELVLFEMPKLKRCSCNSWRDLNASLRVLKIKRCEVLENFTLFESCEKLKIDHKSWLPCLNELTVHECPSLKVSNPLPPSSNNCTLSISRVSRLPTMKRSSNGKYEIGEDVFGEYPDALTELNGRILSFHNLKALTELQIRCCQNLLSISLEGFRQLIGLKSLKIQLCQSLFSPDFVPEHIHEDMIAENFSAFPSPKNLNIGSCGITGKWLSEDINYDGANGIWLLPCSLVELEISYSLETLLPCFPNSLTALKKLEVSDSPDLKSLQLHTCITLEELKISNCESLETLQGLQSLRSLRSLEVDECSGLTSLHLSSCTALEGLTIGSCESLEAVEGFEFLGCLRSLELTRCDTLESVLLHSCAALEELTIEDCASLQVLEGFESLGCLRNLELTSCNTLESVPLHSCAALEGLVIIDCESLRALEGPEGLQSLCSLRSLEVDACSGLTSLHLSSCTALEGLKIGSCESLEAVEGFEFLGCLRNLELTRCDTLESVLLHSCAALEELTIERCASLRVLEGFESLGCLRNLEVTCCRGVPLWFKDLSWDQLETLKIDDESFLTESFCKHLTSLQRLEVCYLTGLTGEQESALQLLTSLQELRFVCCDGLTDLPMGLHSLPSLKRLEISWCWDISRLPKDLPPSLEELVVWGCSDNLNEQCRTRATTKLRVTI
ncbi:hypothetical protein ACP4OV_026374 [Aristida adscensionis]